MARCLRCNAGNEWIEGNAAKSVPLDETDERIADLERRLKEAQQKIVAQQARINLLKTACSSVYDLVARFECEDVLDEALGRNKPIIDDLSALTIHDAKVAEKAKAEALEEAIVIMVSLDQAEAGPKCWDDPVKYCTNLLRDKAAEYRAKAGRKE